MLEYSGLGAGVHLDGTSGAAAPGATATMSGGSLTTSGATDLIIALFADVKSYGAMTAGSGFTAQGVDGGFGALIEDDLPAGAAPGVHEAMATEPLGEAAAAGGCWVGASVAFGR